MGKHDLPGPFTERPPPPGAEQVGEIVGKLGAASFRERLAAQSELIDLGPSILPLLKPHSDSPDPEVRVRVRSLIVKLSDEETG